MKCIRCGHDSKFKDRSDRRCPGCKKQFAFEPKSGDPVTDAMFKNAIDAVSGEGRIRWGFNHLYYEICRRKRKASVSPLMIAVFCGVALCIGGVLTAITRSRVPIIIAAAVVAWIAYSTLRGRNFVPIERDKFGQLWQRWRDTHGTPKSFLPAPDFAGARIATSALSAGTPTFGKPVAAAGGFGKRGAGPRALEADIGDYSFDRAVICDRAETVDLLVANNFHFENNCAILSIDGYPPGPFETIRRMLKRNPRLLVVTLHDATPDGCRLAHRIADDPAWFDGKLRVVDLGLRPQHAGPFRGLYQKSTVSSIAVEPGISKQEAAWMQTNVLELAAVRPEQILKRLFNGLQAHADDNTSDAGVSYCSSFEGGGSSADSGSDHGADSFG